MLPIIMKARDGAESIGEADKRALIEDLMGLCLARYKFYTASPDYPVPLRGVLYAQGEWEASNSEWPGDGSLSVMRWFNTYKLLNQMLVDAAFDDTFDDRALSRDDEASLNVSTESPFSLHSLFSTSFYYVAHSSHFIISCSHSLLPVASGDCVY